jgi:superfamily II DNA or RNA helicase
MKSTFTPYPCQTEAKTAVMGDVAAGYQKQLVVMPTGSGKTKAGAMISQEFGNVLFICHRGTLLTQTIQAYLDVGFIEDEIGMIWKSKHNTSRRVTLTMVQTLVNRLDDIDPRTFDLVIVDEAHRAGSPEWVRCIEHFTPRLRLGLTATPERYDGVPLVALFPRISYSMSITDAIQKGYLVMPKAITISTDVDLSKLTEYGNDYRAADLERFVDVPIRNRLVARAFAKHGNGRKAIGFCVSIQHAKNIAAEMHNVGLNAVAVWGTDPERKQKLKKVVAGEYDCVLSANLLIEGFDAPVVDSVLLITPTRSRVNLVQQIGRGLRLKPGKTDCLILNFQDQDCVRLQVQWDTLGYRIKPKKHIHPYTTLNPRGEKSELQKLFRKLALKPVNHTFQQFKENDFLKPPLLTEHQDDYTPDQVAQWQQTNESLLNDRFKWLFDGGINLDTYAAVADLMEAPPPSEAMQYKAFEDEAIRPDQIRVLEEYGYQINPEEWNRATAAKTIANLDATLAQQRLLVAYGYDTIRYRWSRHQAAQVISQRKLAGIEPNFQIIYALKKKIVRGYPVCS